MMKPNVHIKSLLKVLSQGQSVKHVLWIATADITDLYANVGKEMKPFLALIVQLIKRGVEVRLSSDPIQ